MADQKVTLSVFTADVGGLVGNVSSHPEILDNAKERLYAAREKGAIADFHVLRCGDDIDIIISHKGGPNDKETHTLAWNVLTSCRELAEDLKLYGAGGGMSPEFTGNVRCMGPGVAELEFIERASEPVLIFLSNKASSGAWNLPVYRTFADPFNTAGLVLDPSMLAGFTFNVYDMLENREISLSTPNDSHLLLALIGSTSRYVVTSVERSKDREHAAAVSAQKYDTRAGSDGARSEPALIVRCQAGFPATGEVMEAFSFPHLVSGWMRAAHTGPLMPVPFYEANPTRFDGPPRVISAGFQVSGARLIGPHDMFDDPSFDEPRRLANRVTEYMRRHGPFQPHRLPEAELAGTALPMVLERLKERFRKI